ncbi:hypothetical protein ACVFVO_14010 [Advenella kashmirensis]
MAAALATVKVTGTRFNVRQDNYQFAVAVESGSVEVSNGKSKYRDIRRLGAGQALGLMKDMSTGSVVTDINVATVATWRQGKLVFDGTHLESIIVELNRYPKNRIGKTLKTETKNVDVEMQTTFSNQFETSSYNHSN